MYADCTTSSAMCLMTVKKRALRIYQMRIFTYC